MKKILALMLCLLTAFCAVTGLSVNGAVVDSGSAPETSCLKRNVAYIYGGDASVITNLDVEGLRLTHICFAFLYVTSNGNVTSDQNNPFFIGADYYVGGTASYKLKCLAELKQKYPWLKILISLGGADSGQTQAFADLTAKASCRQRLANALADIVAKYGLDGVDIDWEYPHDETEIQRMAALLKLIREQLGENGVVSAALPADSSVPSLFTSAAVFKRFNEYLDFWNIMTYDMGSMRRYSFVAPMARDNGKDRESADYESYGYSSVQQGLKYYHELGVAYEDMNMGLPYYGKIYSGITNLGTTVQFGAEAAAGCTQPDYVSISPYLTNTAWTYNWCENARCPYLTSADPTGKITGLIVYENAESIAAKCEYAQSVNMGGMMCWDLAGDGKDHPLASVTASYIDPSVVNYDAEIAQLLPRPTAEPTEVPAATEEPTSAPDSTTADLTDSATPAPDEGGGLSDNVWLPIGIAAAVAVVVIAVKLIFAKRKK